MSASYETNTFWQKAHFNLFVFLKNPEIQCVLTLINNKKWQFKPKSAYMYYIYLQYICSKKNNLNLGPHITSQHHQSS